MEEIINRIDNLGFFVNGAIKATCEYDSAFEAFCDIFKKLGDLKSFVIDLHERSENCSEPESFDEPLAVVNNLTKRFHDTDERMLKNWDEVSISDYFCDQTRIANALKNDNINTVAYLISISYEQLLKTPNISRNSLRIICEKLAKDGLKLKDSK